jgi:phosphoribosylformimino-5-aminoimidazole carboxamide ribotide isomerase
VDLYPAVDIRGGRVTHVRSAGGAAPVPSVYGDDPLAAVERLAALGARWVHLVDLDWAYQAGSNRDLVRAILMATTLRVQVGGGLDADAIIGETLEWGAARVVIGCGAAAREPALVERLVRAHGSDRLAVGVDARDGHLAPRSGPAVGPMPARAFARLVHDRGARTVVYTDVSRDGSLAGPDISGGQEMATMGLEVIISGGVASLQDVGAARDARLAGAIVGRALHEGRFTLTEALACASD